MTLIVQKGSLESGVVQILDSLSLRQMANVRFKLRISQNRKGADKRKLSEKFLLIKNCVKLLIYHIYSIKRRPRINAVFGMQRLFQ